MRTPARSSDATSRQTAQPFGAVVLLACRCRRHERVAVDLAVRMIDRRAHLAAAVLEHEHVLDLGSREERLGAIGPQVDDLAHLRDGQARERLRRARARTARPREAPTAGTRRGVRAAAASREVDRRARRERGPSVGEPADVVRFGRLEAADAERAAVARQVRPRLAVPDDVHPLAGERIETHLTAG